MKKALLILGVILVISAAFYAGIYFANEPDAYKTAEQVEYDLKTIEARSPSKYLELNTNIENILTKGGLFKRKQVDGQVISGEISNKATAATFKDVVVRLRFYSKTGTQIDVKDFVIYEKYAPGSTIPFEYRIDIPAATSSYGAEILSAAQSL